MAGTDDFILPIDGAGERRLHILKQGFRSCLAGIGLCLVLVLLSPFFPRRMAVNIVGFSILATLSLFFLSILLTLWHASRSLAIETQEAQRTGSAITRKADEMGRQWLWATALCGLPRWPKNRVTALRKPE